MSIFIPLDRLDAIARKFKIGPYAEFKEQSSKIISPASALNIVYDDLNFESTASREQDKTCKDSFYFQDSLVRLRENGFERHARPREVFELIAAGLEGRLSRTKKNVYDDMLNGNGEWLSLAFEKNDDVLICYLDPEGLIWNGKDDKYFKDNFRFAEKKEFNIAEKPSQKWIELKIFSDDFVQYIYGRDFKDLPMEMREGKNRAKIWLPYKNAIAWPVGRGDSHNVGGYGYVSRASRGVCLLQKKL